MDVCARCSDIPSRHFWDIALTRMGQTWGCFLTFTTEFIEHLSRWTYLPNLDILVGRMDRQSDNKGFITNVSFCFHRGFDNSKASLMIVLVYNLSAHVSAFILWGISSVRLVLKKEHNSFFSFLHHLEMFLQVFTKQQKPRVVVIESFTKCRNH